ncbi:hypothetical protein FISHEDRAFT_48918 [Fistulina hepatica ATCC 64428]|uniref:Uncharacterized protein n=1 Tax=Fistulina hepatica ATCC 64428 TaxID=1128425 RepID=A0A0D7A6J1_9AGAR|nr:hypothetical protein FISHEDRAFT_48918 [Fistulina hepatica ATCC 64428]
MASSSLHLQVSTAVIQPGALIYRQDGTMAYDGSEYGGSGTFEMVDYEGSDPILVWTRSCVSGLGYGNHLLLNQNYDIVANV